MGLQTAGIVGLPSPDLNARHPLVYFPYSVVRKGETLAQGDIVQLNSSRDVVKHSFASCGYCWDRLMDGMLGKEFPILEMTSTGIIALPSPDGSQAGKWYFPVSVVKRVTGDHEEIVRKAQ